MAGTFTRYARDAAETVLMETWKLPDWQAQQVMATAKRYGLDRIPVEQGWGILDVKYDDGYFHIGGHTNKTGKGTRA